MDPAAPTLGNLLQTIGTEVLYAAHLPDGDMTVGPLVVVGAGEVLPPTPGGMVLAIGEGTDHARAELVRVAAAASQCMAVVVKEYGRDITALAAEASSAGIALLVTPDDMPWRQLDSLLTAAASSTSLPGRQYPDVGIGDLFALANAIASSVGGATTVEDPHGRMLAYSNIAGQEIDERRRLAILGRQTPERAGNVDEYHRILRAEGAAVRFELPDVAPRLAVAVRAGTEGIGVIFVLDGSPRLDDHAADALEDAAKVAAIHLLRSRTAADPERREKAEALRALLDGAVSPRVAAGRLAIAEDTRTVVVAVASSDADAVPEVANARIIDIVGLHCGAWHRDAMCAAVGGTVYALLPVASAEGLRERLRRFARDVSASLDRSVRLRIAVGIGPVAQTLDSVLVSRQWADRVLRVVAASDAENISDFDDVRSRATLLELAARDTGELDLVPGPIDAMLAHDDAHATPYAATLLAYLDAFGDAAKAASTLSIHENTLRYRLRRIQELFTVSLTDPDDRLVTWLRLRTRELAGNS